MATATAKKKKKMASDMLPDEAWLNERTTDGRAKRTLVSMNELGKPDVRLQQRAEHLDMNHVHRLDRMRLGGTDIFPVVVFWDATLEKFFLADGFHRHEMYRRAKLDAIPAYVIQGTWRDAMLYSTMCNQLAILERTPEDIKKAVMTLLDDKEWFGCSDSMIASHCGLCSSTVAKYRATYCETKSIPVPETVKRKNGAIQRYRYRGSPLLVACNKERKTGPNFQATINGKLTPLGRDQKKAQNAIDGALLEREARRTSLRGCSLRDHFLRRGVSLESANFRSATGLGQISQGCGVVLTGAEFNRSLAGIPSPEVPDAVGRVLLARQLIDPTARAVVVCYVEDAPPELIEAGRAIGIEFLTPEELVASIKGEPEVEAADLTS